MSHGVSPVTLKDVSAIVTAEPFKLPSAFRAGSILLVLIGLAVFVLQLMNAGNSAQAWATFHLNFVFWFTLAAASTCFSSALHICNAQWTRPIRRIFESASTFFLISPIILLVLFVFKGYNHLFVWAHEAIPGKANWLQPNFVYVRDLIGMCVLIYLGRKVVYFSIRKDLGAIRSGLTGLDKDKLARWSDKKYDCYVANWGSDSKAEIQQTDDLMGRWSPFVIIGYAVVVSLIAFDQMMSVDPHWYSTMFGGFIFMGAVYLAMAWCSMFVGLARTAHPLFAAKVERRTLHDLGKLLFGFGIFWAYLMWSQYLPIWYGNMPEETKFLLLRLRENPWHDFAWIVLGLCFIIPFLLGLSRDVKQTPHLLFCTGMIVACGIWLELYLLFMPSISPHVIPFDLSDVGISLGFLGAFVLSCACFLEKAPLMPFGDLYLSTSSGH